MPIFLNNFAETHRVDVKMKFSATLTGTDYGYLPIIALLFPAILLSQ